MKARTRTKARGEDSIRIAVIAFSAKIEGDWLLVSFEGEIDADGFAGQEWEAYVQLPRLPEAKP